MINVLIRDRRKENRDTQEKAETGVMQPHAYSYVFVE